MDEKLIYIPNNDNTQNNPFYIKYYLKVNAISETIKRMKKEVKSVEAMSGKFSGWNVWTFN